MATVKDGDTPETLAADHNCEHWLKIVYSPANDALRSDLREQSVLPVGCNVSIPPVPEPQYEVEPEQLQRFRLLRKTWPYLLFDAHMHIMSTNGTPLPAVLDSIKTRSKFAGGLLSLLKTGRGGINLMARILSVLGLVRPQMPAGGSFATIGDNSTDTNGDRIVERNDGLHREILPTHHHHLAKGHVGGARFLGISVVLPMDFEYGHMDGYGGIPVYRKDEQGYYYIYRRKPKDGFTSRPKRVWLDRFPRETVPMEADERSPFAGDMTELEKLARQIQEEVRAIKQRGLLLPVMGSEIEKRLSELPLPFNLDEAMRWLREIKLAQQLVDQMLIDSSLYETWNQQLLRTERAVLRHPLRLLPMYHYDPRRYINKDPRYPRHDPQRPLTKIATEQQSGIYIGIKMYTSQGYRPKDPHPNLKYLYEKDTGLFSFCENHKIPIMTHCGVGGFWSYERFNYLEREIPKDEAELKTPEHPLHSYFYFYSTKDEGLEAREYEDQNGRLRWFQENYLHPMSWEPLLDKHSNLRLCLAHFGTDVYQWQFPPEAMDYWGRDGSSNEEQILPNKWFLLIEELLEILIPKRDPLWDEYGQPLNADSHLGGSQIYWDPDKDTDSYKGKHAKTRLVHRRHGKIRKLWSGELNKKGMPDRARKILDELEKTDFRKYMMPTYSGDLVLNRLNWPIKIAQMCEKRNEVYTDISYLPLVSWLDNVNVLKAKDWRKLKEQAYSYEDTMRLIGSKQPFKKKTKIAEGENDWWMQLCLLIEKYPRLQERMMFGTDWYMFETERFNTYEFWISEMLKGLRAIQEKLGLKYNLFHQLAIINPLRFYRLTLIAPKLREAMCAQIKEVFDGAERQSALDTLEANYRELMRAATIPDTLREPRLQTLSPEERKDVGIQLSTEWPDAIELRLGDAPPLAGYPD